MTLSEIATKYGVSRVTASHRMLGAVPKGKKKRVDPNGVAHYARDYLVSDVKAAFAKPAQGKKAAKKGPRA